MTSSESVGLQAADLIAFEAHSALFKKLVRDSSTLRKAVEALVKKGVPIVGRYMDKEAVIALKQAMEDDSKVEELATILN